MVIAWIGYCLAVSALLGIAALAGERALSHYRKPVRYAWAGAIAGSVLLPAAVWLVPAMVRALTPVAVVPAASGALPQLAFSHGEPAAFSLATVSEVVSAGLGWLWVVSIVGLAGYLGRTYRRLRAERREWTPGEILDSPVLMSRDRGPAVVGLRRAAIVMPRWIAELEEGLLRLVFVHEREHLRAGDHRLYALGLAAVVLMPWNLVLWWQLRRLRMAIEYDCDRRVILAGANPREYADALLAVGSRATKAPMAAAAFSEPRRAVERRLRRISAPLLRLRGPRAAIAAGIGALALIFACGSPQPVGPGGDAVSTAEAPPADATAWTEAPRQPPGADAADRPMFIPYDQPPVLENAAEVRQLLSRYYPTALREAGEGGRVELWLYVDENGEVGRHEVRTGSGVPELDEAAARVVEGMKFRPALNRDERTPVWVSQSIAFQPEVVVPRHEAFTGTGARPLIVIDGVIQAQPTARELNALDIDRVEIIKGDAARELYGDRARDGVIQITTKDAARDVPVPAAPGDIGDIDVPEVDVTRLRPTREQASRRPDLDLPPPPAGGTAADQPAFLPYDTPPVLQNGEEVLQALQAAYPSELKDAGIGGRVELWLHIDPSGVLVRHEVKTGSGNPALDAAAGKVAEAMRFSPARNQGQPTPVWISQVITFQVM